MNYANFQRTISLYKVLKISSIKALKTDSFFEQIFIPILNTLPARATRPLPSRSPHPRYGLYFM